MKSGGARGLWGGLLLLFLLAGSGTLVVRAFHLTTLARARSSSSFLLPTHAMRIPGMPFPSKAEKAMLWIFPPFLRHLGLGGASSPQLRRRRSSSSSSSSRRIGGKGSTPTTSTTTTTAKRRLAATSSDTSSLYSTDSFTSTTSVVDELPLPEVGEGSGDAIPILIKYTGGVGYKSLYTGVCRVLRERFGNIAIRKAILGVTEVRGGKKLGTFEVVVGDRSFQAKPGAPGVYLPMADIQAAIERLVVRRDKESKMLAAAAAAAAALASDVTEGTAFQESIHP